MTEAQIAIAIAVLGLLGGVYSTYRASQDRRSSYELHSLTESVKALKTLNEAQAAKLEAQAARIDVLESELLKERRARIDAQHWADELATKLSAAEHRIAQLERNNGG